MKDFQSRNLRFSPQTEDTGKPHVWEYPVAIHRKKSGNRIGTYRFSGEPHLGIVELFLDMEEGFANLGWYAEAVLRATSKAFSEKSVYYVRVSVPPEDSRIPMLEACGFQLVRGDEDSVLYQMDRPNTMWTGLFLCLGISIGATVSLLMNNRLIFLAVGFVLGLALGAFLDIREQKFRLTLARRIRQEEKDLDLM